MTISNLIEDEDLEECIDGSTDLDMVRRLINQCAIDGRVDVYSFSQNFAYQIEGFIDADEGSEAWTEAWNNNADWGQAIAENINSFFDGMQSDRM